MQSTHPSPHRRRCAQHWLPFLRTRRTKRLERDLRWWEPPRRRRRHQPIGWSATSKSLRSRPSSTSATRTVASNREIGEIRPQSPEERSVPEQCPKRRWPFHRSLSIGQKSRKCSSTFKAKCKLSFSNQYSLLHLKPLKVIMVYVIFQLLCFDCVGPICWTLQ